MFTINPGDFKHIITIQEHLETISNDDIPVKQWVNVLKTKAKVTNVRGDEYLQAQNVGMKIEKTFYIRYSRSVPITTDNQILYKDKVYNVVYVNNVMDLNKYIEIKVELKR
ncbi:phage head closure protein [Romboutsia timonensis]|uniref:phage head closure protein n=1 Tax=Romboutsia timonensis TaxID=1776391 RepID=UPI002A7F92BC|nr:phage head closure protein [Romboutsia timonensis]MDY3960172.1 phage head closure protein [Romboutsia timonensis]